MVAIGTFCASRVCALNPKSVLWKIAQDTSKEGFKKKKRMVQEILMLSVRFDVLERSGQFDSNLFLFVFISF